MLQDVDWNAVFTSDVDESAENWTNTFLSIMEKCIPTATLKKRRLLPWLNNNIRKHMRERNIMFRKAKRTNNINHMRKFRQLRNKVVTMLRQERMKYFNALSGASNKTFWKSMKCLHKQRNVIPVLQEDNITAVSDNEMLNTFFSRCWNNTDQPMSQAANMTTYGSPASNLSTNIEGFLCTQEEVSYLLTSLHES